MTTIPFEKLRQIAKETLGFDDIELDGQLTVAFRAIEAEVLRINGAGDATTVFDFTAMEKAMTLASMLAGSVGMNDVHGSEGYSNDLRAHLTQFIRPRATGCPDTMDDMGRFAVDQKAADEEKSPPATGPAG